MNWGALASKLPSLIIGAVQIVEHVKSASGAEKQQAVIDAVKQGVALSEFAADKDLLNDPQVDQAARAVTDAVVAFKNIVAKKQAV